MSDFVLEVQTRTIEGKQVQKLRKKGLVPGVLYGHGVENVQFTVAKLPLERVWHEAGESSLIDLQIDGGKTVKAIIQDIQYEPASNAILHVDLHQVNLKEKVEVDVALVFVGESTAVKELGGTLVKVRDNVTVEGLPTDLVKEIEVNIAKLMTFDDVITVKDLPIPHGLTLKSHPEDPVAQVEAPRSEAELAELESAVEEDVSKVEKIEEKPKEEGEGEEPAEGAAPQEAPAPTKE